jgi:MYXO-CTERM domain-containing protein
MGKVLAGLLALGVTVISVGAVRADVAPGPIEPIHDPPPSAPLPPEKEAVTAALLALAALAALAATRRRAEAS